MQNHFRIKQNTTRSQSDVALHKKLFPDRHIDKQEQKAMVSMNRASIWAKKKLFDENTIQILKNGMIPLTSDIEYKAKTSRGEKKNIYLRYYEPGTARAETTRRDYQNGHLEQIPFTPRRDCIARERVADKELAHSMRYGLRTNNQRLTEYLDGPNRAIDTTVPDNRMLTEPCWKDVDKSKWFSEKNFDTSSCLYRGRKCQDQWETIKGGINIGDYYVEGFETVGDLSRTRKKQLEIAPHDFLTTVTPNHSSTQRLPPVDSTSVRSYHIKKFFDQEQQNPKAKLYPKTLATVMNSVNTEEDDLSTSPPIMPKVIHIKTGRLDTLKESMLGSALTSKERISASLKTIKADKVQTPTLEERTKTSTLKRTDYIKEMVHTYFDQ